MLQIKYNSNTTKSYSNAPNSLYSNIFEDSNYSLINDNDGVSLMEMTVALGVFTIMMLSVTAIFQMVIESQRSAIAAQNTQESMRYVMEVLSKEIRSAQRDAGTCAAVPDTQIYAVTTNTYGDVLSFKNYADKCISYYVEGDTLMIDRDGSVASTTPDEIRVSNLKFVVTDNITSQPKATVKMDVEALGKAIHRQRLKIQTTLSSRFYD